MTFISISKYEEKHDHPQVNLRSAFSFYMYNMAMRLQDKISCKPLKSSTTRSTLMGFYLFTPEGKLSIFFFREDFCTLFKHFVSFVYCFWYNEKVNFRLYIYVLFLLGVAIMRLVCILGACDVITRILQPEIFYSHTD